MVTIAFARVARWLMFVADRCPMKLQGETLSTVSFAIRDVVGCLVDLDRLLEAQWTQSVTITGATPGESGRQPATARALQEATRPRRQAA